MIIKQGEESEAVGVMALPWVKKAAGYLNLPEEEDPDGIRLGGNLPGALCGAGSVGLAHSAGVGCPRAWRAVSLAVCADCAGVVGGGELRVGLSGGWGWGEVGVWVDVE